MIKRHAFLRFLFIRSKDGAGGEDFEGSGFSRNWGFGIR
jgi:hypothetical protein